MPAGAILAGIVVVSFAARALAALRHPTPLVLPDEYTYAELARSLAETGRPLVRGASAGFPALLEPLLTAPLWLAGDAETAYRLTQSLHALAMSLAAVPVYLLARHVGLSTRLGLVCAALAVAGPGLVYSLFVLADPIGYLLALTAVYAGVRALDRPSAPAQLAFLAAAGLASFARLQYVVLLPAFVLAAAIVERGRPVRRFGLTLALMGAAGVAAAALGPRSLIGAYSGLVDAGPGPGEVGRWIPVDAMLLAYAAGWVLVPGAVAGAVWALARPRTRAELAFAALTAVLGGGLLFEAALIAAFDADRFQERYLLALVALVPVAFGLSLGRGRTAARATAIAALALLALSARIPLSEYTQAQAITDAPTLWAVRWLENAIGTGEGALAIAAVAALLALAAVAAALRPRGGVPLALGLALAASGALALGAHAFDDGFATRARDAVFPDGAGWVDRSGLGPVTLVHTPRSGRWPALSHLFWNRTIERAVRLPGADTIDSYPLPKVVVSPNGRILENGRAVEGPLLISTEGSAVRLRGASRVARTPEFELWKPAGIPRLSLLANGHFSDGWLAGTGSVTVWPDDSGRTRGTLRLILEGTKKTGAVRLRFTGPGVDRQVALVPGGRRALAFGVDVPGPFVLHYEADSAAFDGTRALSARSTVPVFARG